MDLDDLSPLSDDSPEPIRGKNLPPTAENSRSWYETPTSSIVQDAEYLVEADRFDEARPLLRLASFLHTLAARSTTNVAERSAHAVAVVSLLFRAELFVECRTMGMQFDREHQSNRRFRGTIPPISHVAQTEIRSILCRCNMSDAAVARENAFRPIPKTGKKRR